MPRYNNGWLYGLWAGMIVLVGGRSIGIDDLQWIGFYFVLACFFLHRRATGTSGVFFKKTSPK